MAAAKATIDHHTIRQWVEDRGGCPSAVKGTGRGDDPGILRIDYPGYSGKQTLVKIDWDTFFDAFEENELAFLYQDEGQSRFSKLVSRDSVELEGGATAESKQNASAKPGKKKAASSKGPHAIKLLEQQHRDVEALFERYFSAKGEGQKMRMFEKIADSLAAHGRIEEVIFYPAILTDATEDELREAVEEHLQVKRVIADLLDLEPSAEQWDAKMHVLQELVEHHVEEEEEELFEMLEDFEDEELEELGEQMKVMFTDLMKGEPRTEVPNETGEAAPLH